MMKLPSITQWQPRERLLAACAAVIVLGLLMDRVVLNPWLRHAASVRREVRDMEAALRRYARLLARKDSVFVELEPLQRYIQRPPMTDELRMAALLQEIERAAIGSGVQLDEIKPLRTDAEEELTRYVLDVRFQCRLEDWVAFVAALEASDAVLTVHQAGLSVQPEAPDQLQAYLRVASVAFVAAVPSHGGTSSPPQAQPGGPGSVAGGT